MDEPADFRIARTDTRIFVKVDGAARYTNSLEFGRYVLDVLITDTSWSDALIDLRGATFLDSTNLGLLAKIAGRVLAATGRRCTVISTDPEVTGLLANTGFDAIMRIVGDAEVPEADFEDLRKGSEEEADAARVMLEAHRELMSLDDENARRFRTVVELLEGEVAED